MSPLQDLFTEHAFWTLLLILHGLLAVGLLGALTHQAMAVAWPLPRGQVPADFVGRFRSVAAPRYANAVCVLWVLCFVLGGWIYAQYRISVRIPIEQQEFFKTLGAFELKEHLAVFGLGLLPFYRYLWRYAESAQDLVARKWITVFLGAVCWYTFLAGHVVNNVRGYGS